MRGESRATDILAGVKCSVQVLFARNLFEMGETKAASESTGRLVGHKLPLQASEQQLAGKRVSDAECVQIVIRTRKWEL